MGDRMSTHPAYPELFKAANTNFIDRPCMVGKERAWQQCYVCGRAITFKKDGGRWLSIGAGLIRHKLCEPPYKGGL